MESVCNFVEAKERLAIKKLIRGGAAAFADLLEFCEVGIELSNAEALANNDKAFAVIQGIIFGFHSYVENINAGNEFLKSEGYTDELETIIALNARADKTYANLYRLYHDILLIKRSDLNVVMLKHK